MTLTLIAAVARNGVIGGDDRLLWRLKSDLKRFRALTLGKPVIMGRKTFLSIGRPLPGRDTIVLSRDASFTAEGIHPAHDLPSALTLAGRLAEARGTAEVMIAGGADVYAQTIGLADRLHITEVDAAPDGDAVFPSIDMRVWRETARRAHPPGPDDEAAFSFVEYMRR